MLLLAAGVFYLIAVKTDWKSTWSAVKAANPWWLSGAFAFMVFAHWIRGARWGLLTKPSGYTLNTPRSFYAVMVGYLVNVATSRGGEIARCAIAAKSEKAPAELLIGTVVTERIIDVLLMLLVCVITLLVQFDYIFGFFNTYLFKPLLNIPGTTMFAIGLGVAIISALIAYQLKRKKNKTTENKTGIFARFAEGLKSVFKLQKPGLFIAASFGIWVCYWLSTACLMQSLSITSHLGILSALSLVIFASIGIAIPLPAGAGVWGAVSFGLSTVYNVPIANAETYAIFSMAFSNLLMIIVGAIAYFLLYIELQKIKDAA